MDKPRPNTEYGKNLIGFTFLETYCVASGNLYLRVGGKTPDHVSSVGTG